MHGRAETAHGSSLENSNTLVEHRSPYGDAQARATTFERADDMSTKCFCSRPGSSSTLSARAAIETIGRWMRSSLLAMLSCGDAALRTFNTRVAVRGRMLKLCGSTGIAKRLASGMGLSKAADSLESSPETASRIRLGMALIRSTGVRVGSIMACPRRWWDTGGKSYK